MMRAFRGTPESRFLARLWVDPSGCWSINTTGDTWYGNIWANGRIVKAHRFAYEFLVGPIPDGMHLDHLCRHPFCVNPDHLEPVTAQVNLLRGVGCSAANAAKTHCPQGHPYDGVDYRGHRTCRVCKRAKDNAAYARKVGKA